MQCSVRNGINGLPFVFLTHSSGSSVQCYLQGATITSYKHPNGKEILFVSSKANFAEGKAIRGILLHFKANYNRRNPNMVCCYVSVHIKIWIAFLNSGQENFPSMDLLEIMRGL